MRVMPHFISGFWVLSETVEFHYKRDDFYNSSAEGYSVDGEGLNLSDREQKWCELKSTFKF